MKVLRLGSSDDRMGDMPDEARAWHVAGKVLEEAIGEPVETICRNIWPEPHLPDLIDSWIDRYEPDFVWLKVNGHWCNFESVPLKIERTFGRFGRPFARLGTKSADSAIASNAAYRLLRRLAYRTIGGATHFTLAEVMTVLDASLRRIIAHEDVLVAVRGSDGGRRVEFLDAKGRARSERKRMELREAGRALCADLRVPYTDRATPRPGSHDLAMLGVDRYHRAPEGQRLQGLEEGEAMVAAWRAARGELATSR